MKIFFGLAARGNQEEEVNNNRKTIKRKKKKVHIPSSAYFKHQYRARVS